MSAPSSARPGDRPTHFVFDDDDEQYDDGTSTSEAADGSEDNLDVEETEGDQDDGGKAAVRPLRRGSRRGFRKPPPNEAQTAAEPGEVPTTSPTGPPRNAIKPSTPRNVMWIVVLVVIALVGVVLHDRWTLIQVRSAAAQSAAAAAAVQNTGAPLGQAVQCATLYFTSGESDRAQLDEVCNARGISLKRQVAGTYQAGVTAWTQPDSDGPTRSLDSSGKRWAVLVSVHQLERTINEAGTPAWSDQGVKFWKVGITVADNGRPTLTAMQPTSAPAGTDAGQTDTRGEEDVTLDDDRTSTLSDYLNAYLIDGDVAYFLAPGTKAGVVHDPNITAVDVTGAWYLPLTNGTTQATVEAQLTTTDGNLLDATYIFVLSQDQNRTYIVGTPGAPLAH